MSGGGWLGLGVLLLSAAIRDCRLLVAPDSPLFNYRTEIVETANADGSVTFAAEFVAAGLTHFIY